MSLRVVFHTTHSSYDIKEKGIGEKVELLAGILEKYGFKEQSELKTEYEDGVMERVFFKHKEGWLSLIYGKDELAIYWYERETAEKILQDFAQSLKRNLAIETNFLWCF